MITNRKENSENERKKILKYNLNRKGEFMNSLYILGNGFDLYMGMKTRYNDFFKEKGYSSIREKLREKLDKVKRDFIINISLKETGIYAKEIFDPIQELKNLEKNIFEVIEGIENLFLLYLIMSNDELIDWKDVEKQIKPYIEYTKKVLSNMQKSAEEITWKNLSDNEKSNELELFIFRKFIDKKVDVNIKNMELKELNKFEKEFGEYIRKLEKPLRQEIPDDFGNKIIKIFNKLKNELKESNINVLTFNYTDYLKEYFGVYINIHGTADNPIFGIDFKSINENQQYIYFTKTSRVLEANIEKEKITSPLLYIGETRKIVFFGHSLAEADYSYFQSIFDYYDIYNSGIELKFLYYNYSDEAKDNIHTSVMNLINTYGKSLDNKDKGSNLLHKLLLESRIKIVEIK